MSKLRFISDAGHGWLEVPTVDVIQAGITPSRYSYFDALRACQTVEDMVDLFQAAIPKNADIIRFGIDGDFFNQRMFDAVLAIARLNPNIRFYAYTKSLIYWVNRLGEIPANLNLNASKGGRLDNLIEEYGLKSATGPSPKRSRRVRA